MKKLKWVFVLAMLTIAGDVVCFKTACKIINENTEEIPTTVHTGITEKQFNSVISEFLKVNKPLVEDRGYDLVIKNKWSDSVVNANTYVSGKKWIINAYGGLARFEGMTTDAYTMILCHELGHHLGGFPKAGWATNEGQADYYATAKCFPRMEASKKEALNVPEIVTKQCSLLHKSQNEINLCKKSSMVGFELATVLNNLARLFVPMNCSLNILSPVYCPKNFLTDISFSTPDKTEVLQTYNGHPDAQCRLDTYFAGAVCNMPFDEDFADDNPVTGACAEEKGDKIGIRPHCWYKP